MIKVGDTVQFKDISEYGSALYTVSTIEKDNDNELIVIIDDINDEDNHRNGNGYFSWRFNLVRKEEYLDEV